MSPQELKRAEILSRVRRDGTLTLGQSRGAAGRELSADQTPADGKTGVSAPVADVDLAAGTAPLTAVSRMWAGLGIRITGAHSPEPRGAWSGTILLSV